MKKGICWGTFDLFHDGHKSFLEFVKCNCDISYVLVISDESVRQNKKRGPVKDQKQRANDVRESGLAHIVLIPEDGTSLEIIAGIAPDVVVFGYDQSERWKEKLRSYLSERRINPEYLAADRYANGLSTTQIRQERGL